MKENLAYLHDEFPSPGHSPFGNECVHWLLLLLGLVNLTEPVDWGDTLPVIRIGFLLQFDEILALFTGGRSRCGAGGSFLLWSPGLTAGHGR